MGWNQLLDLHESIITNPALDKELQKSQQNFDELLQGTEGNKDKLELLKTKMAQQYRKIQEQNKKRSKGYKCELHKAAINYASRKSKSCKKAQCFIKDE